MHFTMCKMIRLWDTEFKNGPPCLLTALYGFFLPCDDMDLHDQRKGRGATYNSIEADR